MKDVYNIMEDLVEERLDTCIAELGMCTCRFCRADIKAYALNRLPTRYYSRHVGSLLSRADALRRQASMDVVAKVMEGASVVNANPRHEQEG